jgi:hypothetical protein
MIKDNISKFAAVFPQFAAVLNKIKINLGRRTFTPSPKKLTTSTTSPPPKKRGDFNARRYRERQVNLFTKGLAVMFAFYKVVIAVGYIFGMFLFLFLIEQDSIQ